MFKPFPGNQLSTKAQSFPRKSSNTTSLMIALTANHARDFTWNQGCSSNSPPLTHGDQIPHLLEESDNQIPSSPVRQRCQMPGVCPGGGGGDVEALIWLIHYLDLYFTGVYIINVLLFNQPGEKTLLNLLHKMVKVAELQKNLGLVRADVDFIPVG